MTAEREGLAEVIAQHAPTYTEYAIDPTATFYCKPCSEAAGDWVTWTPAHLADALADLLAARDRRVRAEAVASILREVSDQTDSIGHHWSGAPALAFFALAGDLRDRADRIEADA